ncbi:hypothetical protein GCM10022631_01630 [Deinococcus rubellus]|uniref:Uncharacterized protein n=1 Tax=Deinococcus rubellus TaxID=1889240 RepID=A0ABY5YI01_9DEIO|nr:hypothetical protein [Deinococcus rubellus]UWX64743.1 hypothetical protein N0D28_03530 [Deinococcus rubellus]
MSSHFKSHVVLKGSIEHALLASASMDLQRTRQQLLAIAIQHGLRLYDDETVVTALKRLNANGSLYVSLGNGRLRIYRLTARGEQVLQAFAESPA